MSAPMTREELRRRLEPFRRPSDPDTVHGELDEILDAVMRGREIEEPTDAAAPDWWDRVMRREQP